MTGVDRRRDAVHLIESHVPSTQGEARDRARMQALLELPGDVFQRGHFEPGHLTASAVLVDPDRRRLLLIEHLKLSRWLQPGGHIEAEDLSLVEAARREATEETGLTDLNDVGLLDLDIHQIPAIGDEPAHEHFDVRFLFEVTSGDPRAGDGAAAARWFGVGDLDTIETDDSVRRLFAKALG